MKTSSRPTISLTDLTFMLWAPLVPVLFGTRLLNADGDVPRHLSNGEFILDGGLFQTDAFAWTRTGPFETKEWLSQVVFALAERAGGLAAVAILVGLLVGLVLALAVALMRRSGADPMLAWLTGVAVAVLTSVHWVARPHLFTFLGIVLLLHLAVTAGGRSRWLFLPLFAFWANLHPGFVLGFGILAALSAGELAEARLAHDRDVRSRRLSRARAHAAGLGLALLGAMFNPDGPALLWKVRTFLGNRYLLAVTEEFQPVDVLSLYGVLVLVVLLLFVAAFALRRQRPSMPVLFVALLTLAGGLMARRNLPLFALAALPLLATELSSAWRSVRWPRLGRARATFDEADRVARTGRGAAWVSAGLIALALNSGSIAGLRLVPDRFDDGKFPVAAVRAARAAGLEGRVFNEFLWGGYLVYAWPEQRIFIDGMTDFLGNDVVRSYLLVHSLDDGWEDELKTRDVSIVIVPPVSRLAQALASTGEWQTWYSDATAAVLRRTTQPAGNQ